MTVRRYVLWGMDLLPLTNAGDPRARTRAVAAGITADERSRGAYDLRGDTRMVMRARNTVSLAGLWMSTFTGRS